MQIAKYISIDPKICHGKPCFKGTRIPVHMVLDMLASGETPEEILKNAYPKLTKKHIEAALGYAAHTAQEGHIISLVPHAISRR